MINSIEMKNFGVIKHIKWDNLSKINLIIGANGTGKSFLLKALYCSIKTIEDFRRGDDYRNESEIISDRLHWTFQADKIGDLVNKAAEEPLCCEIVNDGKEFKFEFGKDTTKKITNITNRTDKRGSNSIFIPAKEVLSAFNTILKSREQERVFGFDDTYYDLAKALQILPKRGKNYEFFSKSRTQLSEMIKGKIEFLEDNNRWQFKKGNQKFSIGVTAEGVKKIAILDTLLSNRYLDNKSIVFIDEPESSLHPSAITELLDIVSNMAECGVQLFLASHSYFALKKLALLAKQQNISIPVLSLHNDIGFSAAYNDLRIAMPENSIVNESIRLYEEEIEGVLK